MGIYNKAADDDDSLDTLLRKVLVKHKWPAWSEKAYDEDEIPNMVDDDSECIGSVDYETDSVESEGRYYDMDSIAVAVMKELVANGHEDLLLIKNPEVGAWWNEVVRREKKAEAAIRRAEEKRAKAEFDARAKAELINRLTPEEKRLLGL